MLLLAISTLLSPHTVAMGDTGQQDLPSSQVLTTWLTLGPVVVPEPAFAPDESRTDNADDGNSLLSLDAVEIEDWWPAEGEKMQWDATTVLTWSRVIADSTTLWLPTSGQTHHPERHYLVTYIDARRWIKATLKLSSLHALEVAVDGRSVMSKATTDTVEWCEKEINLEPGNHIVWVKLARAAGNSEAPSVQAELQVRHPFDATDVTVSTSPRHRLSLERLLHSPSISDLSVSFDGQVAAITCSRAEPPDGDKETWVELRDLASGGVLRTYRGGMTVSGLRWAPARQAFVYKQTGDDHSSLWLHDLGTGQTRVVLKEISKLGSFRFTPDGKSIIYSVTDTAKTETRGVKRLRGMTDRWPDWRDRSFLYQVHIESGTKRRLTAGPLTTTMQDISPDSRYLVFSRSIVDFSKRPYSRSEFYRLDLKTLEVDTLFSSSWANTVSWSPDGTQLLVTGGPSTFGRIGVTLPDSLIPNEYDTQAFIYTLADSLVQPITLDFDPSVSQAVWSPADQHIYLVALDKSHKRLYRYNVRKESITPIETSVEVIEHFDVARTPPVAVYSGTSVSTPETAYGIDLRKLQTRRIAYPGAKRYEHLELGQVKRWTFENARGREIEGRIYLPPDFDASKRYPCIVYYYGGTSPVSRDFGGRYPKNLYAANGYVVYVLQPSGAIGFGQEFSALHVNDWGRIVADEIIQGVDSMLTAHPFIDRSRVGCIGASYGGFMTMLLQTRTDIFAAAVSHAGISSLAGYWGEGYWGYIYSAVATANSFPWNRTDFYIESSPLFHADKINTPLLLLHGMGDTNVPPGESIQLYTALKLLDKDVEFVQVEDQNHWILDYKKRLIWKKSILAWFDKWLKDQPQWWEALYPGGES